MTAPSVPVAPNVDREVLREAIQEEYEAVAREPERGFHFHTGRSLARILGYRSEWLDGLPEGSIESFAGTGNPFSLGTLAAGERVVDIGCGAGIDSLIAAGMVGPEGAVIGIDMTPSMLEKAQAGVGDLDHVEFRLGFGEELPVPDGWADVIISNGVVNLMPDKQEVFAEMARVLKPGGRIQIGDILVDRPVPENAKEKIELWTG
jgi:SAM-dependent methyltransferase